MWYYLGMTKALALYEELKDRLDYTLSSWLHLEVNPEEEIKSRTILGAAAFLFDNLFAKENAGEEITKAVYADQGEKFVAKALSEMATLLRVNMSSDLFAEGKSPLRDYLRWVKETEPEVEAWQNDFQGKLVVVTVEELVNVFTAKPGRNEPLRIAELFFINLTETFAFAYKELLGPRFQASKSIAYFLSVTEAMEGIRSEIRD